MSKMSELALDIQEEIDRGEFTFQQIADKYGVSLREVDALAFEIMEQDVMLYDHMERDWDEPYEPEGYDYPDPDAEYESRYELEDF
jgi:hypothetical protein